MNRQDLRRRLRLTMASAAVLILAACSGLPAPKVSAQNTYMLEAEPLPAALQTRHELVLQIGMPRARPGFDTPQMAYLQQPHELNYFVTSRWADTPARMLAPLVAQAIAQTQSFRSVVQTPAAIPADLRLDTEVIRLHQDFTRKPSRVRLTLRAQLIDVRGKRILAARQFEETENAAGEDAYGGVAAANRMLPRLLGKLAEFCITASSLDSPGAAARP